MAGPLAGFRVLDVGQLVQGPQAAALFADMGADVIKVELPGFGDLSRWIFLSHEDRRSAYYAGMNRGKRGITLDLRKPAGADVFRRLVESADVVVSNFRVGTLESWGLGYDDLAAINPRIVWAAGSAFGALGPDADREGADLAGQCAGGLISTIGHDGLPPSPVGVTIADHIASQNLASGVLAALLSRERTGRGQRVDVSLLGGQIWAQASEYTHYFLSGEVPGRANGGHPLLRGIYGIFETKDGWIGVIGVPPAARDAFFVALECPELALDPRFQGLLASREDMTFLFATLTPAFRQRTTDEWCAQLRAIGVRYAPVRHYGQVAGDAGAWENGYFRRARNAEGEEQPIVGTPIAMTATPLEPAGTAPGLGEHTDAVLGEFGYSAAEIAALRADGVI
ncbi:MAG: CoA transferase [Pseudomonadales bacterium]|nr:CoA transferase [Pseudomonadales bacterium]MCP5185109.1 CoA transferase [Pseudomonadales bacterium]